MSRNMADGSDDALYVLGALFAIFVTPLVLAIFDPAVYARMSFSWVLGLGIGTAITASAIAVLWRKRAVSKRSQGNSHPGKGGVPMQSGCWWMRLWPIRWMTLGTVLVMFFFIGRAISKPFFVSVFPLLPNSLQSFAFHFFVIGGLGSLVFGLPESRYFWRRCVDFGPFLAPGPMTVGFISGYLSWFNSRIADLLLL